MKHTHTFHTHRLTIHIQKNHILQKHTQHTHITQKHNDAPNKKINQNMEEVATWKPLEENIEKLGIFLVIRIKENRILDPSYLIKTC